MNSENKNRDTEKIKKAKLEPLLKFDLREILSLTDVYTIIILLIYTVLAVIFYTEIKNSTNWILINLFIIAGIISIATVDVKLNAGRIFKLFRKLTLAPLVFFIYTQAQIYIRAINPHDYDAILIAWDKFIFGVNPTQWLKNISFPALTEYLQFTYMTYFFLPMFHGVELHLKGKDLEFDEFSRMVGFAFFMSYLCYFVLPAVGPRFTLHDFSQMSTDLPGLWLTEFFRGSVNSGGGIPSGININPVLFVNRDCMPSGHTWITLVNIYLGFKFRSKLRWVFLVFGGSLIFGTIYLRYHYVVDVLAAILLAVATFKLEKIFRRFLVRMGFSTH